MRYPKINEVEDASRMQLCRWHRFLPSPGQSAIGNSNFNEVLEHEAKIQSRISERLAELGGFTVEISKALGWE